MAASSGKASGDQERLKANFDNAASEIKEDVVQLAAVWAEAGLLLWHHCYRGEEGQAEIVGAGVAPSCLATLDSQDTSPSEKSTAAGILLTLCEADPKHREMVCKAKSGPNTACQVLHSCMGDPETAPRHVVALLASLASDPASLSLIQKTLQSDLPWSIYRSFLELSDKDHGMAVAVAKLVQHLVTGREQLAEQAATAGILQTMLQAIRKHKSAAAIGGLAACLQALCEAAPANRQKLGQLPGAVQALVDLLGSPPATIIAWEQEQYKHILNPQPPQTQQTQPQIMTIQQPSDQQTAYQRCQSIKPAQSMSSAGRSLSRVQRGSLATTRTGGSIRKVTTTGEGDPAGAAFGQSRKVNSSMKPTKSIRLPDELGTIAAATQDPTLANKRQQVSMANVEQAGAGARHSRASKMQDNRRSSQGSMNGAIPSESLKPPALPQPTKPLLCKNSTALKWEGPVPDTTRSAVASVLAELVLLPDLCAAVNDRLPVPRLTALLQKVFKQIEEAGKGKKSKKASKLTLSPEAEALLTHICVCLKFLVVTDNANCYRVAAAGCLPALVLLGAESKHTRLRTSAQAVLSQVCMLSEVQELVKQGHVPEELWVQVPMKLIDNEIRQLLIEFPDSKLQPLDDVTAKART